MKRLLFALLAILTGLSGVGPAALAAVGPRNVTAATSSVALCADEHEQASADPMIARFAPSGAHPLQVARKLFAASAPYAAVQLQADRAHE